MPVVNCYIFYNPSEECPHRKVVERCCIPQSVGDEELLGEFCKRAWIYKDDQWQEVPISWNYMTGTIEKMMSKEEFVEKYFELKI